MTIMELAEVAVRLDMDIEAVQRRRAQAQAQGMQVPMLGTQLDQMRQRRTQISEQLISDLGIELAVQRVRHYHTQLRGPLI